MANESQRKVVELERLRRIARQTSIATREKYGLEEEDVVVLCRYMKGDILDSEELVTLLPVVQAIQVQIKRFPHFYYNGIGLELSRSWDCLRSRIAIDEGVRLMYVIVPVKARAVAEQCGRGLVRRPDFSFMFFFRTFQASRQTRCGRCRKT